MPRLAVAIPLYNHEDYVGLAIASALGQTLPADKIVVVDDGSTDRSVEAVRAIADPRIELLTQKNAGAHVALNRAIAAAGDHEFVAILNSDDCFHQARLERTVAFLQANPAIDVVCTGLKMIDPAGRELDPADAKARRLRRVWSAGADLPEWLGIANFAKTTSNIVARRAYLLAHPFRDYRYVHDYFFLLQCALDQRLGVLREELLFYRTHPANTIKAAPENVRKETLRMNLDLLRELAPALAGSAATRRDYTSYFRSLAGNHADFRTELFLAILGSAVAETVPAVFEKRIAAMTGADFFELCEAPSSTFKDHVADVMLAALERTIFGSRWYALGRALGLTRDLLPGGENGSPHARLSALERRLEQSRWLQLGRKFGFL